jgi:hypothetical protein
MAISANRPCQTFFLRGGSLDSVPHAKGWHTRGVKIAGPIVFLEGIVAVAALFRAEGIAKSAGW